MAQMDNPFSVLDKRLNTIETFLLEIRQSLREHGTLPQTPSNRPRIGPKSAVQQMTGWPDGTFYAKVHQMPEGVVIRGKSKRLLFDLEKLEEWLKTPVNA